MNSLNSLLGSDSQALRIAVLFLICALIALVLWFLISRLVRSFRRGGFSKKSRQPRIGILEETEIDPERRLILVRRDNVEHLILVGGKNDLIVEQNISRAIMAAPNNSVIPQQNYQPVETPENAGYRATAKVQARTAAQVSQEKTAVIEGNPFLATRPPAIQEPPKVEPPKTEASKAELPKFEPLKRADPPPFISPQPIATPTPAPSKPVSQTTFDNLENELASLLGQKK